MGAIAAHLLLQIISGTYAVRYFDAASRRPPGSRPFAAMFLRLCVVMLLLMVGIILQMAIWALLYHRLDTFSTFEEALYFSVVTFTTSGYGDFVLKPPIRLLAPLEAANGLTKFAIVTVVLIGALRDWGIRSSPDDPDTKVRP